MGSHYLKKIVQTDEILTQLTYEQTGLTWFHSFISEFTQDVTDTQMGHVAPVILPEMYKIFLHADVRLD